MTVEEYAAACEATGDDLNSMASLDEDASSSLKAVEEALAEGKTVEPAGGVTGIPRRYSQGRGRRDKRH